MLATEKADAARIVSAAPRANGAVRITAAALDESDTENGEIVLRGRIDAATLHRLLVDTEYQRGLEIRAELDAAFRGGDVVPDVVLGCRGTNYEQDGSDFLLRDPVYIIDGWQRIGNARKVLEQIPHLEIRIGCLVHFGTNQNFERKKFTALNRLQKKVKTNLHLRNMRQESPGLLTLYGLCHNDRDFPLRDRVCWEQHMARHHLITANHLVKCAQYLHRHQIGISGFHAEDVAASLDRIAQKIGLQTLRHNVGTFFAIIEEAWGIRNIEYRAAAPHIKGQFLNVLAHFFTRHPVFWENEEKILRVDSSTRSKLRSFNIHEPHVAQLAGSSGAAREILYQYILKHVNSGRREHRLVERAE